MGEGEVSQPAEPMTALVEAAASCHEIFRAYVAGGFSEDQALEIVIAIMMKHIP